MKNSETLEARLSHEMKSTRGLFRSMLAKAARWLLAIRYRLLSRRYDKLVIERVGSIQLVVLPGVFNPVLLRSGAFQARFLETYELERDESVLDLGTGSGIAAIAVARGGCQVSAVDINPNAVRCTKINAILNEVEDRIRIYQGDLFEPVLGQKFDLVLFNPPFHIGQPQNELDRAWRGVGIFERFAQDLSAFLTESGRALLLLSSDGDGEHLLDLLDEAGCSVSILAVSDLINEVLTIYEVKAARTPK